MSLIVGSPIQKCRSYTLESGESIQVPSYGEEGWTITPFVDGSLIERDGDNPSRIYISCYVRGKSIIPKVKSTLLMKRVFIIGWNYSPDSGRLYLGLDDPDMVITDEYLGGIISIARFDTNKPKPDHTEIYSVDLTYCEDSPPSNPVCAIYLDGEPLQLNPERLHSMGLTTYYESMRIDVPTAWVDPGFVGTLFVPFCDNSKAILKVSSWNYKGENKYDGFYSGSNRIDLM